MIKKLICQWKQEWWLKEAKRLAEEFKPKVEDLNCKFEDELSSIKDEWESKKKILLGKIDLEKEEIQYRIDSIESKKRELVSIETEVKNQIKIMEAKSNPSFVWETAFTAGATKTWDLLIPLMTQNIEKMIKQIKEESALEAIARLKKK